MSHELKLCRKRSVHEYLKMLRINPRQAPHEAYLLIVFYHNAHGMNAYMADHMSVCMIQLENRWTDFYEIWYGYYAFYSV
jgi:hypothetical protein